jgi:alkylated DNA repair dioxygenase AlkB
MAIKRIDEAREATVPPDGFSYVQDFLTGDEQRELLERLRALNYTHDVTRGKPMKRGYAQFGHAYVTKARRLAPAPPLPDFLAALAEKTLPHCSEGTRFDQCIVTRYPVGAGIGWHPDEDVFGDYIAAVSLAAPARLQFRPNEAEAVQYEVVVEPGSLYVMRGPARWDYQHRVPEVRSERYSITFRSVELNE